jgi:hypothetical protein
MLFVRRLAHANFDRGDGVESVRPKVPSELRVDVVIQVDAR